MVLDFQGSLSKIDASLKKTHVDRVDLHGAQTSLNIKVENI